MLVGYRYEGVEYSFRSVVRFVRAESVWMDPVFEVRASPPFDPGTARVAEAEPEQSPDAPFVRMRVARVDDPVVGEVLRDVEGGDLHLRARHRARRINVPRRLAELIQAASLAPRLAITLGDDPTVYAGVIESVNVTRRPNQMVLTFQSRESPEDVLPGTQVRLTFLGEHHMFTMPAVALRSRAGDLICRVPTVAYRYQRRVAPRYRIDHAAPQATVDVPGHDPYPVTAIYDLSLTGAGIFVSSDDAGRPGDRLVLRIRLTGAVSVDLDGVVTARSVDHDAAAERLGVQFVGLEARRLRTLAQLIQKLTG